MKTAAWVWTVWTQVVAYGLLANVCIAVLVTAVFSRKFYTAISTTDTAAYYVSLT